VNASLNIVVKPSAISQSLSAQKRPRADQRDSRSTVAGVTKPRDRTFDPGPHGHLLLWLRLWLCLGVGCPGAANVLRAKPPEFRYSVTRRSIDRKFTAKIEIIAEEQNIDMVSERTDFVPQKLSRGNRTLSEQETSVNSAQVSR